MKLSTSQVLLALLTQAVAHVQWIYPAPRKAFDGFYSTAQKGPNVCHANQGCDSFCGVPIDTQDAPVTQLPVGTDVTFQWKVVIPHYNREGTFRYRLALNGRGDGDAHFDDLHSLIGYAYYPDNHDEETDLFTFTGKIPESFLENCSDPANPCALQLFDDFFFVSCANVVLFGEGGPGAAAGASGVNLGNTGSGNMNQAGTFSIAAATPAPTPVDQYPHETNVDGVYMPQTLKLADGSEEPNNLGFCPDILGDAEYGTLDCRTVHGGSCQPIGTETSFGYSNNLTRPAIYATHFGGGEAGSFHYYNDGCVELQDELATPGCITAYGLTGHSNHRPSNAHHIFEGAKVALFKCENLVTQQFVYTTSGKFQIQDDNDNIFCLGMQDDMKIVQGGLASRSLGLMNCDADPKLITWTTSPRARYFVEDGSFTPVGSSADTGNSRNLRA